MIASPVIRDTLRNLAYGLAPELAPRPAAESDWRTFLTTLLPEHFGDDPDSFADYHAEFFDRIWAMQADERPEPIVLVLARGYNKSTSAQGSVVIVGAKRTRRYVLYVSKTQPQADDHVQSIGSMLESDRIAEVYPEMGKPQVKKTGPIRGWNRNRLWTRHGLIVDAIGLDTAARGVKLDYQRPDMIVFDDIDDEHDTPLTTQKKIDRITRSILPAGAKNVATIAVQNLIIDDGVFARLIPGSPEPADFLADRVVIGPHPAVHNLEWEMREGVGVITGGESTWPKVKTIADCQAMIKDMGIVAFLAECQHETRHRGDKIYKPEWWSSARTRYDWHDAGLQRQAVARYMGWDTATSLSTGAAYSACVVADIVPFRGNHAALIREVRRGKMEFTQLLDAIRRMGTRWQMDIPPSHILLNNISIEMASSGVQAVQTFRANAGDEWLASILQAVKPVGSKDDRSLQCAVYCMNERIWLPIPDGTPETAWLGPFEQELFDVPEGMSRDMTDAFSQTIFTARHLLREPITYTDTMGGYVR